MERRIVVAWVVVAAVGLSLTLTRPAVAQETTPDLYGQGVNLLYISAEEFMCSHPQRSNYTMSQFGYWYALSDAENLYAALRLPAGSLILGYRVFFEDSGDGLIKLTLKRKWYSDGERNVEILAEWASDGPATPGISEAWMDVSPDAEVHYRQWSGSAYIFSSYYFKLFLGPGWEPLETQFTGVLVSWKRQISPAPTTATFSDVPTGHWAFPFVEALAASGITAGCGGGNYCPDDPITRAEMAVYLSAALGLHWDS